MKSFRFFAAIVFLSLCSLLWYMYFDSPTDPDFGETMTIVNEEVKLKRILLWNSFFRRKDYGFGFGRDPFFLHKCEYTECLVTDNRSLTCLEDFDAIVFHGSQFYPKTDEDYPATRSPHQLYVYFSQESPHMFRASNKHNGRFNTTITYRLDSDVQMPYFNILDMEDNVMAPAWRPQWIQPIFDKLVMKEMEEKHKGKKKPAAWFVSRCASPNKRKKLVYEIREHIDVDIYGKCGNLTCPHRNDSKCYQLLKTDYFFYLSFENSNCLDYVTEKFFNALNNDVIPIVFNGADMKTIAPEYSYIDASQMTPPEVAERMKFLIKNPKEYAKYFWWKKFYRLYFGSVVNPFCGLCKLLHDNQRKPKTYDNYVDWFHGPKGFPMCRRGN